MTPKEKSELKAMVCSGNMYNDYGDACHKARGNAAKLLSQYWDTSQQEEKTLLLRSLFNRVGDNVSLSVGFRCEFGFNISIGDNVFINYDCIILDCNEVTIGNNVLFGPRVGIYGANHAIDANERNMGGCYALPIQIGNNVWIGGDVKLTAGVSIGDNSIIGTGSVVTKDIPANVIAAGVPCKVIRPITNNDKTGYQADTQFITAWE